MPSGLDRGLSHGESVSFFFFFPVCRMPIVYRLHPHTIAQIICTATLLSRQREGQSQKSNTGLWNRRLEQFYPPQAGCYQK